MSAENGGEQPGRALEQRSPDWGSPVGDKPIEGKVTSSVPRSPQALERAIEERRARLAATIDEIGTRTQPKELARRGADEARRRALAQVQTPDGDLRTERIAAVAGAALAVLVLIVVLRSRRRR